MRDCNECALQWIRTNAVNESSANMTACSLACFVNLELLPNICLPPGFPRAISVRTATRWLDELGFEFMATHLKRGVYKDRHEREDVQYREEFIAGMRELEATHPPPPLPSDGFTPDEDPNFDQKQMQSVVGAFNHAQEAEGCGKCSNFAAQQWLRAERGDKAIFPCRSDYCDTCKEYQETSRQQTTVNSLRESGHFNSTEITAHQKLADSHRKLLSEHKLVAQACIDEYKRIKTKCDEQWKQVKELEAKCEDRTEEETQQLVAIKDDFTAIIDADYQMAKLRPHWGYSAQPGSSYYKKKTES